MRSLTLRERNVIRLRFDCDLTQAEIGEHIGVSQVQVSRILRHSVARLGTIAEDQRMTTVAAPAGLWITGNRLGRRRTPHRPWPHRPRDRAAPRLGLRTRAE